MIYVKVIVVGCTHAGTASILNIKKQYPDAEITVYERNDNISFLSCGIALYVGGIVKDSKGLFYCSPEKLMELGVTTKMKHDVLNLDVENKKIKVKNLDTSEEIEDKYDKLVLTTGSWPIVPKIEGIENENILLSKNFYHSNIIIEKAKNAKNVVVIGAGYIGVELVESFRENGKNVTLIDAQDRIMFKYLDKEFTDVAQGAFEENGIKLALGEIVQKFEGENGKVTKVVTDKGDYEADLVILCIGFKPNTELLKGKLEMLDNGAIIIDEYMRTSQKDIFAAGDCCVVKYNPTDKYMYIPLATNAVRMGTLVGMNLVENKIKYMGTQGTSGIKIYDYNIASTGLTEFAAKNEGIEIDTITINENNRPEFMPTYENVTLKVVYDKNTKQVLGAQMISKIDTTQMINTLSVVIQNKMKMEELAFIDFFFQPHYNKPWSLLNQAGLATLKNYI